jgi:anti-sigma B factor antagonist
VATEWLASGVPVVSVDGELDLTTASTLEETLLTLPDHTVDAVIVDLRRCRFVDLRGLHVLLAARERLERSNRPLGLICGNPDLLRVLKVTRVDGLFEIWPSLTAAADRADDG